MNKSTLFLTAVCIISFMITNCKSKTAEPSKEESKPKIEKVDMSGPEYTSKYICPMHCAGSGSDHPGKCPVCEMDYELNEQMKSDSLK